MFFITAVNDIAQYVVGSTLGKMLFAPKISPKKTLEGVLGGMVVSSILSIVLMPSILSITLSTAAIFGGLTSIAGVLGDLTISKLKRSRSIKDTGTSIAGHEGLLDRVDSLLLIMPVFGILVWVTHVL